MLGGALKSPSFRTGLKVMAETKGFEPPEPF